MRKIIILLFLIVGLIFLRFVKMTGMYANIVVFTPQEKNLAITYFSFPSELTVGENGQIKTEVENIGSANLTLIAEIFIKDSDLKTVSHFKFKPKQVFPGQSTSFTAVFVPSEIGKHYVFVVINYDGENKTKQGSFSVNAISKPTPSLIKVKEQEVIKIETLNYRECIATSLKKQKAFGTYEISFCAAKPLAGLEIKIEEANQPKPIAKVLTSYKTFEIKINQDASYFEKIRINFKVPTSWVKNNNIDENTIKLLKFDGINWVELPTKMIKKDKNYFYFESSLTSFSIFTIAGEKKILELVYPEQVNLTKNQTTSIYFVVKNKENIDLYGLYLLPFAEKLEVSIIPTKIDHLPAYSSAVFVISLKAPISIREGSYPVEIKIISDKYSKKAQIRVSVISLPIEKKIKDSISNYQNLIFLLEKEILKAKAEKRDVGNASMFLGQAKQNLEKATQLYEQAKFNQSLSYILLAKKNIEQATKELAKSFKPAVIFVPYYLPRPDVVVSAGFVTSSSVYYYYRKKKEEKKYRKSIRKAIEIIKLRGEA